jgi:hypothetical protein
VIPAVLVALAVAGVDGSEPVLPAEGISGAGGIQAEPEVEAAHPDHRGWRHAIGLGRHSTTFFSKESSQYTFHSASLGYMGSFGSRGPFLHAFTLLTLQARQDGHVYDAADYYRRRIGADFLFGWQWRWAPRRGVEAEAGPGLHGMLIYLPGKAGYRDFSAFPLGLGVTGTLWWGTSAQRLARTVTLGAYASVAYDFRDPMHANDLAHGYSFRAGLSVGLGARR